MENSNPLLWLAWALFGSGLVLLLWRKYLPLIRRAAPPVPQAVPPQRAWLICEDGTALDRRARWFELRAGGRTVVGARPRAATADSDFVYLTADDIAEDHALIAYDVRANRYRVAAANGSLVRHNNEPLVNGAEGELADGDTLDLGKLSRFRFTVNGPDQE